MTKFNYPNKAIGSVQRITNILQLSGKYLFKRNYLNTSWKKSKRQIKQGKNQMKNPTCWQLSAISVPCQMTI